MQYLGNEIEVKNKEMKTRESIPIIVVKSIVTEVNNSDMSEKRAVKIEKSGKDKVELSEENKLMDNEPKGNNEIKKMIPDKKYANRKFKEGKVEIMKKAGD